MDRSSSRAPRRRVALVGALAASMLVFGLAPISQATHTTSCGGHQGEPMLLGCANQTTNNATSLHDPGNFAALWVTNLGGNGVHANVDDGAAIYGTIAAGSSGIAVHGQAVGAGPGVLGESAPGFAGVKGTSPTTGVWGVSKNEGVAGFGDLIGVRANSPATALKVEGPADFSRSGKVSIGAGLTKKDVSMTRLTSATFVTATLQGAPISGLWVQSVQVIPTSNKFTIHLNKAVPAGTTATVGYFVVR